MEAPAPLRASVSHDEHVARCGSDDFRADRSEHIRVRVSSPDDEIGVSGARRLDDLVRRMAAGLQIRGTVAGIAQPCRGLSQGVRSPTNARLSPDPGSSFPFGTRYCERVNKRGHSKSLVASHPENLHAVKQGVHSPRLIQARLGWRVFAVFV